MTDSLPSGTAPRAPRTVVVVPAYNAAATLAGLVGAVPALCDELLVVDDGSRDATAAIAVELGVPLLRHERNRGYGASQKTGYREALRRGADLVVMLHGDAQYDPRVIPAAVDVLRFGICDLVLGNRIRSRREALAGGMPLPKYVANRGLTLLENVLAGQNLGEWHSGFRAYRRELLEAIPFDRNDDGFAFDSQLLLQAVHFGFRLGDVPVPVRYFPEASSIGFGAATGYALRTLALFGVWYLHRLRLRSSPLFTPAARGDG